MSDSPLPTVATDFAETFDTVSRVLKTRRTINQFKPEIPPREIIEHAIDVARFAPNHHLTEPWHFYLLSEETKERVVDVNTEMVAAKRGADAAEVKRKRWSEMPGWLVVTCDKNDDPMTAREDYAAVCCAIHSLSLVLWAAGVGTKWTTGPVTRDARFHDAVWIDAEREDVVGMLWYGYPENIPDAQRKPVEQILVDV